jgi:hypothetical protein
MWLIIVKIVNGVKRFQLAPYLGHVYTLNRKKTRIGTQLIKWYIGRMIHQILTLNISTVALLNASMNVD